MTVADIIEFCRECIPYSIFIYILFGVVIGLSLGKESIEKFLLKFILILCTGYLAGFVLMLSWLINYGYLR